jgi:serine/threonine-protein kinase
VSLFGYSEVTLASPIEELHPGATIANKYRVERVLGYGGMGVVVAAMDTALERRVAIKTLLPELASDSECVVRFLREGRAVARLTGEHTVHVFEAGTLASGVPYMVMEFLAGTDVEELVAQRGRLPVGEAVDTILQAVEGVAEAHAFGIVHRDLKLSNLFLTQRGDGRSVVKVLDFGLAKATRAPDAPLTATTAILGTPAYMSPEQLRRSKDVDVRTDVWALGVCLYQALTGRLPFDATTVAEMTTMILKDVPRPPYEIAPVPVELSTIVLRCLEKSAAQRYASLAELANALEPHVSREVVGVGERLRRITLWAGPTETYKPEREPEPATLSFQAHTAPLAQARPIPSPAGTAISAPSRGAWPLAVALVAMGSVLGIGGLLAVERLRANPASSAPSTISVDNSSNTPPAAHATSSQPSSDPAALPVAIEARPPAPDPPVPSSKRVAPSRPPMRPSTVSAASSPPAPPPRPRPTVRSPEDTY